MIFSASDVDARVSDLLTVLDEEIRLLDLRRSQLEALSVAIVERDDDRLEVQLDEIQQTAALQADVDVRLENVRRGLAGDLAMPPEQLKLHVLADLFEGRRRAEIESRRRRIIDLAERLQRQHMHTSVLLSECARVNRLLLDALFPQGKGVDTYGSDGQERWRPETGMIRAES